jgi:hypothetical protein
MRAFSLFLLMTLQNYNRQSAKQKGCKEIYVLTLIACNIEIYGRQEKDKSQDDQEKYEFPYPFHPLGVWNLRDRKHCHQYARARGDHVGESVAELEGKHCGLA